MIDNERKSDKVRKKIDFVNVFWAILVAAFTVSLVGAAFYPLYKTITADGKADYCYVEAQYTTEMDPADRRRILGKWVSTYALKQHIPWRGNRTLVAELRTPDDVRKEAEKFNCQIK